MINVFLLEGGLFSTDGVITSAGMGTLAAMLRAIPDVRVVTYLWHNWTRCYGELMAHQNEKCAVIGYSGGGMKSTWVANGCILDGSAIKYAALPRIDLLVAYDPSPAGSLQKLRDNVKKAICYHNTMPLMFGLGGGQLTGPHVTTINVGMQHLAIQFSLDLHNRTVGYVMELKNQNGIQRPKRNLRSAKK